MATMDMVIQSDYSAFLQAAEQHKAKVYGIVVTDISQKHEMKRAKEERLELKRLRLAMDKRRVDLKKDALAYCEKVQRLYNEFEALVVPMELHLKHQEEFKERHDAMVREDLIINRTEELMQYNYKANTADKLGDMAEGEFEELVATTKKAFEDELERKRLEDVAAEQLRIENERLKAEKEKAKQEEKERKDREKHEESLRLIESERKLREEKERVEKELEVSRREEKALREQLEFKQTYKGDVQIKSDSEKAYEIKENKVIKEITAYILKAQKRAYNGDEEEKSRHVEYLVKKFAELKK